MQDRKDKKFQIKVLNNVVKPRTFHTNPTIQIEQNEIKQKQLQNDLNQSNHKQHDLNQTKTKMNFKKIPIKIPQHDSSSQIDYIQLKPDFQIIQNSLTYQEKLKEVRSLEEQNESNQRRIQQQNVRISTLQNNTTELQNRKERINQRIIEVQNEIQTIDRQNQGISQQQSRNRFMGMIGLQNNNDPMDNFRNFIRNIAFAQMFEGMQLGQQIDLDRMSYEEILQLQERMGGNVTVGFTKEEIKKIHKCEYIVQKENDQCSICCEEFQNKEKIRKTPCGHIYHSKCIKPWLQKNKTCPLCKREITIN